MRRRPTSARILVPPGIGDGYWVLTKLRAFMERHGLIDAEIHVHDSGPRRADGMWRRVPFVRWGGYAALGPMRGATRVILNRAYRQAGVAVQRRVLGFDYFLSLNGSLDHGLSMDRAMPGRTEWFEPLTKMEVTETYANEYRRAHGEYVAVGLWDHGFYRHWTAQFPEPRIVEALRAIADERTVVIMGAGWDQGGLGDRVAAADERFINLVGATDFDALTGVLSGAAAVFGFPAGNTMLGPRFGAPTLLVWNEHFPRQFWHNACPPDPRIYRALGTKDLTVAQVIDGLRGMMRAAA